MISHRRVAHPCCHRLSHALLEGEAEGAVASVTAVAGQLLGCEGALGGDGIAVEMDEVIDAQIVDVGIVGGVLAGEILAKIETVGTNGLCKLGDGQVVLQVELRVNTILLQQRSNVIGIRSHLSHEASLQG